MNATLTVPTPEMLLSSSPIPELRRLVVESTDDEVIIRGKVSSYYVKQMAQESLRSAVGPRRILNRVVVTR